MALEEKRTGQVPPRGKQDPAADGTAADRRLQGGCIIRDAVARGTETANIQRKAFGLRTEGHLLACLTLTHRQRIFRIRMKTEQGNYRTFFHPEVRTVQRQ